LESRYGVRSKIIGFLIILNGQLTKKKFCLPVKAVLVRILLPVVAGANLEDEEAEVLGGHFDGDIDPLAGHILTGNDASVAPKAS
jgi:hypothetical protein